MTENAPTADGTVTMYSTPWCGYCKRLKMMMASDGITFVEVDIEQDAEAEQFVLGVNGDGTATVPVVRFPDGSAMTNPTFAQVKERLGV